MSLEESLTSRDVWVVQGPEFTLEICIRAHCSHAGYMPIFLKLAGELLANAKLWSDLGLVASSKGCEYFNNSNSIIGLNLSLGLQEKLGHSTDGRRMNVPDTLRNLFRIDAQPPVGIQTVILSGIRVSLEFNSSNLESISQFSHTSTAKTVYEKPRIPKSPAVVTPGTIEVPENSFILQQDYLEFPLISSNLEDYSQMLLLPSGPNSLAADCQSQANQSSYINRLSLEHALATDKSNNVLSGLLDIGFRSLISSNPLRTMGGIERSSAECIRNLSDIAPAVFSPGYRDAVSQRACFVPVIAKAMSSMLSETNSQSLQQRLFALQESAISQYGDNLNHGDSSTPDTRSMIKCLLWRIVQKGVYRPEAARKLSPIDFTMGITERDYPMLENHSSIDYSRGSIDVFDLEESDYHDFHDYNDDDDDSTLSFPEDEYCSHDPDDYMDYFSDMLENSNDNADDVGPKGEKDDSSILDEHEQSENMLSIPRSSLSLSTAAAAFSSSPLTLNDDDIIPSPSTEREPDVGLLFSDLPELETSSARAVVAAFHDIYIENNTENGNSDEEMLYD
ncbi:hypothetical protein VTN00DRAFT_1384 [Thermoascus crustaceus]|uniref:uncharacterized protein n=1 Tax=Thermoascus crustaceus TaxID=5088 RepID=UPI003743CB52